LRLARELRQATLDDVGKRVAASPSLISHLEKERREPTTDLLHALGDALGFEPGFFFQPIYERFVERECSFRRRTTTPQGVKKEILSRGTLLAEVITYFRAELTLPELDLPHIPVDGVDAAERAADAARVHWRLGLDAPLGQVGRVVERAGVPIVEVDVHSEKIDAFCRWGDTSMIVLNSTIGSASRRRMDIAHELGHLIMHRGCELGASEVEDEANRFASAFLMPAPGFRSDFASIPRLSWPHLFALKRRWRTSVAAIVRRAWDLRLIGADVYRRMNQYIRARGWHRGEPDEPEMEHPELLKLALLSARADLGRGMADIAEALDWKLSTLEEITGFGAEIVDGPPKGVVNLTSYRAARG
jgi:Zn-dependent peptidase ImmA (M78 family)